MRWAASLVCLAACASVPSWDPVDLAGLPSKKDHPHDDALILLHRGKVEFHQVDGKPVADITEHVRVLVLTERGRAFGTLRAFYTRTFSSIIDARARCLRPDGTIEEIGREKMRDMMAIDSSILYEDSRLLHFAQETAPLGSVIEYQFTERHFDPKLPQFSFMFGDRAPVEHAEFTIEAPLDWEVESVATRSWQPIELAPKIEEQAGLRRWIWTQDRLPALAEEELAPALVNRGTVVAARLKSWMVDGRRETAFATMRDFSKWMSQLHQGTADPNPEIEATVRQVLIGSPDDPREKARRLYEWVQENVRYVGVEIGIGGWKPHSAAEIFETKYGDCKDKATLLKSFLEVAGIESHLAALYSHDGYPRRFMLPSFGNANHVILVIELPNQERVIVDPTERTVPFGALPTRDQEAELLMIRSDGADPFVAPSTDADFNTLATQMEVAIDERGDASGSYRMISRGDFAWRLKYDMLASSDDDRTDSAHDWLLLSQGTVDGVEYDAGSTTDPSKMEVTASGKLTVPRLLSKSGAARVLRVSELIGWPGDALSDPERTTAVVFRRRERRTLELSFSLPSDSQWSTIPPPAKIESPFGWYSLDYRLDGDKLVISSSYQRNERIVASERYPELRKFFDEIRATISRGVVIKVR